MHEDNALFEEELQHEENLQGEEPAQEQQEKISDEVTEPCGEQIPGEEIPVEEAAEEEIPDAEASDEEISAQDAAEEEIPGGETPAEETSGEETPGEEASEEARNEEASALPDTKTVPYHERYYLRYREGKRSAAMDLEGTKAFLQDIGFDGGELRQAREGKDRAESFRKTGKNKNNQMHCSYCGTQIAGVEFYRLPDGRVRCTTCSSTVVKTKAEVEELCKRVLANMENFFGATIDVPISIQVVDERKLKKKIGVPLGTRDSQSMLILGVAINKKKKYSIILENGAPRISLIATFAHELTHIWQYTHWDNKKDFKKCPKSKRLLVYEGMAKWAEIQYLYLIGETNVAKREEEITRNRQDEYGIGFCLYEDRYPLSREAMACEDTPFTPNSYPFE